MVFYHIITIYADPWSCCLLYSLVNTLLKCDEALDHNRGEKSWRWKALNLRVQGRALVWGPAGEGGGQTKTEFEVV